MLLETAARNIRETLLHEIAHALTSIEHDRVWWRKFLEIGGEGYCLMNDGRATSAKPRGAVWRNSP